MCKTAEILIKNGRQAIIFYRCVVAEAIKSFIGPEHRDGVGYKNYRLNLASMFRQEEL